MAAAIKLSRPDLKVVGVEPAGAAKMSTSLAAGHPVTLDRTSSIADGLMPVRPGDLTFEHVQGFVDQVVTVDDGLIARAALWLFHEAKQVVEPSGAATVAATLWPTTDSLLADKSKTVVAILSGGNVAPETLASLANSTTDTGAIRTPFRGINSPCDQRYLLPFWPSACPSFTPSRSPRPRLRPRRPRANRRA